MNYSSIYHKYYVLGIIPEYRFPPLHQAPLLGTRANLGTRVVGRRMEKVAQEGGRRRYSLEVPVTYKKVREPQKLASCRRRPSVKKGCKIHQATKKRSSHANMCSLFRFLAHVGYSIVVFALWCDFQISWCQGCFEISWELRHVSMRSDFVNRFHK